MINSLSFCLSKNVFILPLFLKDTSAGNRILTWQAFFVQHLKNVIPLFPSFHRCVQNSAISYISFFESNILFFFHLVAFKSLSLVFNRSIKVCLSVFRKCIFLCIYLAWGLLNYLNLWVDILHQFWKMSYHYLFKYLLPH